jgi:hypothetical protein
MKKKKVFFLVALVLLSGFRLSACGLGEAKKAELGDTVELEEANVEVVSVESADTLVSNETGSFLESPEGKKYIIVTYNIEAKEADMSPSDLGLGLYEDDTTDGIAEMSSDLTDALSSSDYIDADAVGMMGDLEKDEQVKVQEVYEVDEDLSGAKIRIGEQYSWDNLYSVDVDEVITEKPDPEISEEMQDFANLLDGTAEGVNAALDKYLAEGVSDEDMGMYSLEKAEIVGIKDAEGEAVTYVINTKSGITVRVYELTWENGKITKVVDKGFAD